MNACVAGGGSGVAGELWRGLQVPGNLCILRRLRALPPPNSALGTTRWIPVLFISGSLTRPACPGADVGKNNKNKSERWFWVFFFFPWRREGKARLQREPRQLPGTPAVFVQRLSAAKSQTSPDKLLLIFWRPGLSGRAAASAIGGDSASPGVSRDHGTAVWCRLGVMAWKQTWAIAKLGTATQSSSSI